MGRDVSNGKGIRALAAFGAGAALLYGAKVVINVFGPQPRYAMSEDLPAELDSEEFIQFLSIVTDGTRRRSRLTRLKDGREFYPAYLEAVRRATKAINLEFYEFLDGRVGDELLAALTERARAGVEVRVLVDAVGSFGTPDRYFDGLRVAGGQMKWYHPVRWDTWPELNQRTHRKLLILDGETGFIGGAGVGDHWLYGTEREPVWRDTVFCVEGEAVAGMISAFSENWLEASGEILSGSKQFGFCAMPEGVDSFVVSSTPRGGGTQARILFQALIKSAKKSIRITTPYFLPDRAARHALLEAVSKRGVSVQILMAGPKIDHKTVRELSRRSVRHMVRGGAEVWSYQPAMIHAKLMTVDGMWSVLGSTNFDHRSFALNDEVNMAVLDRELAGVIEGDFTEDLRQSRRLTLDDVATPFEAPEILADLLESSG
ncbi:MAG: phospholipase D-like domain-containing protein [Acidobacteriaceae bacterium]